MEFRRAHSDRYALFYVNDRLFQHKKLNVQYITAFHQTHFIFFIITTVNRHKQHTFYEDCKLITTCLMIKTSKLFLEQVANIFIVYMHPVVDSPIDMRST